jgi:hypothetical protein
MGHWVCTSWVTLTRFSVPLIPNTQVRRLCSKEKLTKSEIARRLGIGRTPVRRLLEGT